MIQDLKDLKALFKLCRAQGITTFKMNGIEVVLGNLPEKSTGHQSDELDSEVEPNEEDIIFWSSDRGQAMLDKKVGIAK